MLARGWERQLDIYRNGLFYGPTTRADAAALPRVAVAEQAVSYVALPDAPLDYSAQRGGAAAARRHARPTCAKSGARAHWRLFAVLGRAARSRSHRRCCSSVEQRLVQRCTRRAPGSYTLRVHFTPYWALAGGNGCVSRRPETGPRCRRAAAGSVRRRHRLLARARLRARPALHVSRGMPPREHRLGFPSMVARARLLQARVLPHGWLDVLRQVSLFAAAYLAYRARARGWSRADANAAFAHARERDLARAHAARVRRALDPGVGVGQPLR